MHDLGEAVARAIERSADADAVEGGATPSDRIEVGLERTPLSSRVALEKARRSSERPSPMLTPYGASRISPSAIPG